MTRVCTMWFVPLAIHSAKKNGESTYVIVWRIKVRAHSDSGLKKLSIMGSCHTQFSIGRRLYLYTDKAPNGGRKPLPLEIRRLVVLALSE